MTTKKSDRHSADSAQLKAWVPRNLKKRFYSCVASQGVTATAVLEHMLAAYCEQVEAQAATEVVNGAN